MPSRDGTGPNGQGARTGRGMGNCNGQGGVSRPVGRGGGCGFGGRGMGFSANQGNSWIQSQLDNLQAAIERLAERLDKINKE